MQEMLQQERGGEKLQRKGKLRKLKLLQRSNKPVRKGNIMFRIENIVPGAELD